MTEQISKDVFKWKKKILIEKMLPVMMKNDIVCSSILIYEIKLEWNCVGGFCGDVLKAVKDFLEKDRRFQPTSQNKSPANKSLPSFTTWRN